MSFRTYRVSRIEEALVLESPAERPANFDLAAHWKTSTDDFRKNRPHFPATLRLAPSAAAWVRRWRLTWSEQGPPDDEGWTTFQARFEHEDEALFVVLGLGPRVDVVEPDALRERALREANAIIARAASRPHDHDRSVSASPPETSPSPPASSFRNVPSPDGASARSGKPLLGILRREAWSG